MSTDIQDRMERNYSALPGVMGWRSNGALTVNGKYLFGGVYPRSKGGGVYLKYEGHPDDIKIADAPNVNDHFSPSIIIRRQDKRIVAASTGHGDGYLYIHTSVNPSDPTSFTTVDIWSDIKPVGASDNVTYAYLFQLEGVEGWPIYLFTRVGRDGAAHYHWSKSMDGGETWSVARRLWVPPVFSQRPYPIMKKTSSTRIDVAVDDGHPDELGGHTSQYYFQIVGDQVLDADENVIGTLDTSGDEEPLEFHDMSKVFDGPAEQSSMRAWDIVRYHNSPAILYQKWPDGEEFGYHSPSHIDLVCATRDGEVWNLETITRVFLNNTNVSAVSQPGACFDPDDPFTVYASKEELLPYVYDSDGNQLLESVDETVTTSPQYTFSIHKYRSDDANNTWYSVGRLTTSGSNEQRPKIIEGRRAEPRLIITQGDMRSFNNYDESATFPVDSGFRA